MTDLKSMLLVTAPWSREENTFRLIPATNNCPYLDVVYNKEKKALEITSMFKRTEFVLFAKIDDNGDIEKRKTPKTDPETGEQMLYKQERKNAEIIQKYFILDQTEIISFVETFAVNAGKIDYMQYFQSPVMEAPKASIIMP